MGRRLKVLQRCANRVDGGSDWCRYPHRLNVKFGPRRLRSRAHKTRCTNLEIPIGRWQPGVLQRPDGLARAVLAHLWPIFDQSLAAVKLRLKNACFDSVRPP